jgi:hypothetical protein
MKGNIDYDLLAIEKLRDKIEETKEHGNYSVGYQLGYFIDNNKYNPIDEYELLQKNLLKKYLKKEDQKEFYDLKENWKTIKGKQFLTNIEKKYSISALDNQIANFLIIEYFSIRKQK